MLRNRGFFIYFSYMVYGTIDNNPMKQQELNNDHLLPVQMVSTDHYILRTPGRLYQKKQKKSESDPSDMYSGRCVLIDHSSGYVRINHQVYINSTETFKEKFTFQSEDKSKGLMINIYHTDNGIFNTSKCMEELLKKQQNIRFIWDGASHQNGVAQRSIKIVVNMASVILIQTWMIFHKDTLSIDFGQRKWTTLYGSKVISLIYSMVYKPLGKFEPYMFWSQGFIIMY